LVFISGNCLCCPLIPINLALSLPAWIIGRADLKAIQQGRMDPSGQGMTQAGMILGIVGIVLGILGALGMLLVFVLSSFP